jgi:hypothetical protein
MKKQRKTRDKHNKIQWKKRKLGLLGVFARIGKGGKKDFWASYVMLTNIVCTSLALVLNIQNILGNSSPYNALDYASVLTITIHFLISIWLYLFAKLIRTMKGSYWRVIGAMMIAMIDASSIVVALVLMITFFHPRDHGGLLCLTPAGSTDTATHLQSGILQDLRSAAKDIHLNYKLQPENTKSIIWPSVLEPWAMAPPANLTKLLTEIIGQEHPGIPKVCVEQCESMCWTNSSRYCKLTAHYEIGSVKYDQRLFQSSSFQCDEDRERWNVVLVTWLVSVLIAVATQWALALKQGLQLATLVFRQTRLQSVLDYGIDTTTDTRHDVVMDGFQSTTFNTWIMSLALIFLERPYNNRVFDKTQSVSPFQRVHPFNADTTFLCSFGLIHICRAMSIAMFFYVGVAYISTDGWGALTAPDVARDQDTNLPHLSLVLWALLLFTLQSTVSIFFSYVLASPAPTSHWAFEKFVLFCSITVVCLLDLFQLASSGYFLLCIQIRTSPWLQCEKDFGVDLLDRLHQEPYVSMAGLVGLLYIGKLCLQVVFLGIRRKASGGAGPAPSLELSYLSCALSNALFHGTAMLVTLFPLDVSILYHGRFSTLNARPHWTNGIVLFLTLLEKTSEWISFLF